MTECAAWLLFLRRPRSCQISLQCLYRSNHFLAQYGRDLMYISTVLTVADEKINHTFLTFQHFIFFVSTLIDMLVPDIPGGLDTIIKRESYQAKQIMSDHHGLMGSSPTTEDFLLELET